MKTKLASLFASALLLSVVPALTTFSTACAGPGPDATLVVDTGSEEELLCVALDSESVSGIRLIELASQQHGISYSLGYGGQAVCMLAGVGSDEDECFEGGQPFWGYWRASGSSWTWSGTGAGGTVVEDGDVEGWSWGTGNDGGSHQQPPMIGHEAVCGPEETEAPGPGGRGNGKGDDGPKANDGSGGDDGSRSSGGTDGSNDGSGSDASDASSAAADEASEERSGSRGLKEKRRESPLAKSKHVGNGTGWTLHAKPGPDPSPSSTVAPSSAPAAGSSDAPPVAGLAGLLVAVLFGLAGAWFLKRRHVPQN